MIVKEILLNALANAGHIHDGDTSEADELGLALRLFNTEMKFYSSKNLITAYQAVLDIDDAKTEQVIGKYNIKKGRRVYVVDEIPEAKGYVKDRDYVRKDGETYGLVQNPVPAVFTVRITNPYSVPLEITKDTSFLIDGDERKIEYHPYEAMNVLPVSVTKESSKDVVLIGAAQNVDVGAKVTIVDARLNNIDCRVVNGFELAYHWEPCGDEPYEYVPDVVCENMERVMTVMYKTALNQWEKLRFVPLTQFYTEDDDFIYCTSAAGENKVKLTLPEYIKGRSVKVVYNTNMDFQKNDRLELPDNHIALVEVAVTVAILRHDADSDPTRLNNYLAQLKEITDNIEATTVTERRIMRSGEGFAESMLRSGRFITNRFGRR